MHKNTKLTPLVRKEIFSLWRSGKTVTWLAEEFRVTRKIIYRIVNRARKNDFSVHKSMNKRYRHAMYGLKHLAKAEKIALGKLAKRIHRYEKDYPGEMVHIDSKSLRRTKHESSRAKSECLFVAIDDYSRQLFADILPKKNMENAAIFLESMLEVLPYDVECIYSDNGKEFKGSETHEFGYACRMNGIQQKFTRPGRPQTNGKAERVIRTLLEECLNQDFRNREERRKALLEYVNYYNSNRPHSALTEGKKSLTPCQILEKFSYLKMYTTR